MQSGDDQETATVEADVFLTNSVEDGDEAGLAAALQRGADPRQLVTRGQVKDGTLLTLAAASDRPNLVQPLVAAGVAVDCRGTGTHTPLHLAADLGKLQVAAALIKAGADVDAATGCAIKHRPLHLAARAGHADVVQLLLRAGADIEAPQYIGFSPLHEACAKGQLEVVRVLVAAGADKESSAYGGLRPIHRSALWGFPACIKTLVEAGADKEPPGQFGKRPVHCAAMRGHLNVLEELVTMGCDMMSTDDAGWNAVHNAASYGRLLTAQWLANHGVPYSSVDNHGKRPIDVAHMHGFHHVAWWLYKQSSDPHPHQHNDLEGGLAEYEENGGYALEWARDSRTVSIEKQMPFRPAIIHFQDNQGWTPLHHAAFHNKVDAVKSLLFVGAFPQALTHRQQTPADIALLAGHVEVAKLLEVNKIKLSRTRRVQLYSQLLHAVSSSELQVQGKSSEEAVHAKWNSSVKEVSQLLSAGAPLEPVGPHTSLPLHLAVSSNCVHLMPLLLSAGAPLTTSAAGVGLLRLAWLSPDVTTYVAVVITRAFSHKLLQELREIDEAQSQEPVDIQLREGMESLHAALTGSQPWTASWGAYDTGTHDTDVVPFEINEQQQVNQGHLNELLERASHWGLSVTASFLVHGGASVTTLTTSGRTPLHAALDAAQSDTARVLLHHLRANPFQKDVHGRRSLDLFPGHDQHAVVEGLISQDYRTLSYLLSKARTHQEREEAANLLLLLAVLFSAADFYNPDRNPHGSSASLPSYGNWHSTFLQLKASLKQCSTDDFLTNTWLKCALSSLREEGTFMGEEEVDNDTFSDEGELFFLLIEELLKLNDDQQIQRTELHDATLTKALLVCSQSTLPLLVHLVLTVGGMSVDHVVEEVSGATPLHVAAAHGRLNFCNYLLNHQPNTAAVDTAGRTPAHLAFMFGYSNVGKLLSAGLDQVQDKAGNCPESLLAAFKKYLSVYHLDSTVMIKSHEKNDPNTLINAHLRKLKNRCGGDIKKAVQDLHIDFTSGEAQEIKKAITRELEKIVQQVGTLNPLMAGDLQVLGSSADNLRLYAPDEYDCNVVLKNITGFPGGGLHFELASLPSQEAQMKSYSMSVCATESTEMMNDLGECANIVNTFFDTTFDCGRDFAPSDIRLNFVFPGITRTQVGAKLSFAWEGSDFPLLLIDVDLVPVISLPWPQQLHRPQLTPKDICTVHLTNTVTGNWRFSFAAVENQIFRSLTKDQRLVFLACKLLILSLKVESWAPQDLKVCYSFWDGRNFKIPAPPGFILKCAFLQELEKISQDALWEEPHMHTRMISVFKRMCICDTSATLGETKYYHNKTKPYFGGEFEMAAVGLSAPKILTFLESWKLPQSR